MVTHVNGIDTTAMKSGDIAALIKQTDSPSFCLIGEGMAAARAQLLPRAAAEPEPAKIAAVTSDPFAPLQLPPPPAGEKLHDIFGEDAEPVSTSLVPAASAPSPAIMLIATAGGGSDPDPPDPKTLTINSRVKLQPPPRPKSNIAPPPRRHSDAASTAEGLAEAVSNPDSPLSVAAQRAAAAAAAVAAATDAASTPIGMLVRAWTIDPLDANKYTAIPHNVTKAAELPPECHGKVVNRHGDILPNPQSRVTLRELNGDPATTYMNANYVRSFDGKEPRKYIACMGPLGVSQVNFWRMVWDLDIFSVVMTTGLEEKGRQKCVEYWPREAGAEVLHGGINVKCVSVEQRQGFVLTTIDLVQVSDGSTKCAEHYWYNSWPDHGVPKVKGKVHCDDVLNMLSEVNAGMVSRAPAPKAPILVHCSAGVGRTGTFIAVDWSQRAFAATGKFNLIESIYKLRDDRVALVQTLEQYKFVHMACQRYTAMQGKKLRIADFSSIASADAILSPSVAGYSHPEERLVPMVPIEGLKVTDVGKPCVIRKFEDVPAVLMWIGVHASKGQLQCGIALSEPIGTNDGSLRLDGEGGSQAPPYDRYFRCAKGHGVMTSPANVTLVDGDSVFEQTAVMPGMLPSAHETDASTDISAIASEADAPLVNFAAAKRRSTRRASTRRTSNQPGGGDFVVDVAVDVASKQNNRKSTLGLVSIDCSNADDRTKVASPSSPSSAISTAILETPVEITVDTSSGASVGMMMMPNPATRKGK